MRAAIRQLDRAALYLDAVESMALDDRDARRALAQLKHDLHSLATYLAHVRSATAE